MQPLEFPDGHAWDAWLTQHHDTAGEAWLRIGRKHAEVDLISIHEALDGALCHGWIDGVRHAFDEVSFLQRYSPRRPRTAWSRVNVERAEALEAAGRMRPGGLAQLAAARADGRWASAYPRQADGVVPDDLAAALAADPDAAAAFAALDRTAQYGVTLPLFKARSPEQRAVLLERSLQRLREGDPEGAVRRRRGRRSG